MYVCMYVPNRGPRVNGKRDKSQDSNNQVLLQPRITHHLILGEQENTEPWYEVSK